MGEVRESERGYSTFGEFFLRPLDDDARPVDEAPNVLVSPCDGVVQAAGDLRGARFMVKGREYHADELIDGLGWWADGDGSYIVVYLSPADYHRVHSPTAGKVVGAWRVGGTCYPVNRLGQRIAPWAIVRNERVVFELDAEEGPVTTVMVGALAVKAIEPTLGGLELQRSPDRSTELDVERGTELAVFGLGSTVVVLWQGRSQMDVRVGERVRVGQRIATRILQ